MQGNFSYYNPTKLYFGDESLNFLKDELKNFGPVVLLNYGSGSVKRNGIYDQVVAILKEADKTIVENPGVMTNPTLEKLNEGVKIARENNVDLILALGGGRSRPSRNQARTTLHRCRPRLARQELPLFGRDGG